MLGKIKVYSFYKESLKENLPFKIILCLSLCFAVFSQQKMHAQFFTHDLGVHAGLALIQTDYGSRNDFLSSYGNESLSLSVTHTLHFFQRDPRWNFDHPLWSHLALRSEFNVVTNNNLRHYGEFVNSNSDLGRQLVGMTGTTKITNMGFQVEYYMICLRDFMYPWSDIKWNPYFLGGMQFTMFNTSLSSSLGDWTQDPSVLPVKWRPQNATQIGPGSTFAVTFGGGFRYKFNNKMDINIQGNWQFFFSDALDGLQADVIENKNNEWLLNFQLGVIYHMNFSRPLFE